MLTPVMSLLRESYLPLHIGPLFLKGWSYRVMVVLNLKPFRYRWHSLFDILDYIEDKWSHRVTKVIFIALVNPSTATIHHQKYLRKNISIKSFSPIFAHYETINWSYTEKNKRGNVNNPCSCNIPKALKSGNLLKLGKNWAKIRFRQVIKKNDELQLLMDIKTILFFYSKDNT